MPIKSPRWLNALFSFSLYLIGAPLSPLGDLPCAADTPTPTPVEGRTAIKTEIQTEIQTEANTESKTEANTETKAKTKAKTKAGNQSKADEEIGSRLKAARLLTIDKDYQKALDDYLWVFENSHKYSTWQGVRNAYVSQELVKLAESYEPAKAEVLKLRDDREKLILDNKATCADVQDWAILNTNLKDEARSVSVYKQLNAKGDSADKICDWIEACIPVTLVKARQYKDLLPWAERSAAAHIATVEDSEKNGFTGRLALPLVMPDVYASYEVLLAEGKQDQADKLVHTMLRPWASHDMFTAFVRAARRTGHEDIATDLLALARKKVSATDYELILGELK